jgi:hypothetical protein
MRARSAQLAGVSAVARRASSSSGIDASAPRSPLGDYGPFVEVAAILLRDWLEDLIEDELEFTEEFESSIRQSEAEMTKGRPRTRQS